MRISNAVAHRGHALLRWELPTSSRRAITRTVPRWSSSDAGLSAGQRKLSSDAAAFYNNEGPGGGEDRNWMLAQCSQDVVLDGNGIVFTNHHFGVGDSRIPADTTDQALITKEIHRLEMAQVDRLVDHITSGVVPTPADPVFLDAGCGRGGTAFRLWQRLGGKATIHGVTVAQDQRDYAARIAKENNIASVHFHLHNMLHLPQLFSAGQFDHIYANETDMYIEDATALYKEFYAMINPTSGGTFTLASWVCSHEVGGKTNPHEQAIDINYRTLMHTEKELLDGLRAAGFVDVKFMDITKEAVPYWEVRDRWDQRSGVEKPFLEGYADGSLLYVMIHATKRPTA